MGPTNTPKLALNAPPSYPNLFVFPRELRDATPEYGARALVFDEVSGSTGNLPAAIAGRRGAMPVDIAPRAQAQFLVHESGELEGRFVLSIDLDTTTMRALGQFLIDLAQRAEEQQG
jgi:hypothetical protein